MKFVNALWLSTVTGLLIVGTAAQSHKIIAEIEGLVQNHSQSLHNLNRYFTFVDQMRRWHLDNYRSLETLNDLEYWEPIATHIS